MKAEVHQMLSQRWVSTRPCSTVHKTLS